MRTSPPSAAAARVVSSTSTTTRPTGGGAAADITANSVFSFTIAILEADIIAGIISAQRCSGGSVVRLREGQGDETKPLMVISQTYPHGVPELPLKHKKELHMTNLISFRTTHLLYLGYSKGGWFISECPALRGDESRPVDFDPAFADHLSVQGTQHWVRLRELTGAIVVTSSMCSLREGYPQKLENFMITQNLLNSLGVRLSTLVCVHPTGTHATSFAGTENGKLDVRSSQRWLPELCSIIADGIEPLTPRGGPSFQLGCGDVADIAMKSMALRDAARWLRTAPTEASLAATHVAIAAASLAMSAPYEHLPQVPMDVSPFADIDAHPYQFGIVMAITTRDSYLVLDPIVVTRRQDFESPYVVMASDGEPADDDGAPQTDRALELAHDREEWKATDAKEIDTLMNDLGTIDEVVSNGTERVWKLKFVRKKKQNAVTKVKVRRSRLVLIGTGHEEGIEFDAKSVSTPMFSTNLTIIAKASVLRRHEFAFDMTQFFQLTPCDPPGGPLYGMPPKDFRKQTPDGKQILWVFRKWIRGARGAGNATRKLFESHVMSNDVMQFERSVWDPSLFFYHGTDFDVEFTLHGDDGTGSANSLEAAHKLKALLVAKYGDKVKWEDEHGDTLGFAVTKTERTTTITAPKHIEALKRFVANDAMYKPTVPYTKDFSALKPVDTPERGSVDWYAFDTRVHFMQECGGHIAHIVKVRPDCAGAYNMVVRTSHAPCILATKCLKHLVFYLIHTIDVGLTIPRPINVTIESLIWETSPPRDYLLDTKNKTLKYHVVLDGALGVDRSMSSILHMFCGIAISGQAFRQHSMALSAHDTECFTASTGAAQTIPTRGVLHELLILQVIATPIFSDSASTRLVASYEAALKRSVYIARRILYMREGVTDGQYAFYQCIGDTNPADVNTKVVTARLFLAARLYFMGV